MPNQNNFRTDLTTKTEPRYTVSRIINVPDATILNEEVPASFGYDGQDTIELHFYTEVSNQLILSTLITLSDDIIKSHIVQYNDGTYKNYIRIDFTKLFVDKQVILIPGNYRMVLNFFSDEIGAYNNRILNLDIISDTRTEVQLSFNNTTDNVVAAQNLYLLKEFVEKVLINLTQSALRKIILSGVELNDSNEGLTAQNIQQNLYIPSIRQTDADIVERLQVLGIQQNFDAQLNTFLTDMYEFIKEEIVINGDERIQESEFRTLIQKLVKEKINNFNLVVDQRIRVT